MKIWILIWFVDRDSWGVSGVFSSKEKALEAGLAEKKANDSDVEWSIEEWPLDDAKAGRDSWTEVT